MATYTCNNCGMSVNMQCATCGKELVDGTMLMRTFTVDDLVGSDAAGTCTLHVVDGAARDEGTLNSWNLEIITE